MNSRPVVALAIPVVAAFVAIAIIYLISRILLGLGSRELTPPVALFIAMAVLIVCALLASRTETPSGH